MTGEIQIKLKCLIQNLYLKLFLNFFSDRKGKSYVDPASAKAEYELAAELGLATKDEVACRKRYSVCPYTADEMMGALRNSQL